MMTKKNFEAIADRIASRLAECDGDAERFLFLSVLRDMAEVFENDNPRFDRRQFFTRVGIDPSFAY